LLAIKPQNGPAAKRRSRTCPSSSPNFSARNRPTGFTRHWRRQSLELDAIGAAWPNKDGQGFNITYDALPLTGRIVMRAITERPEAKAA
jgi:hypothetical protein